MKFLLGFVLGTVFAAVGVSAQSLFPDPFQQTNEQWQRETQLNEYSIMRDGGTSYQKSFQQGRNPC